LRQDHDVAPDRRAAEADIREVKVGGQVVHQLDSATALYDLRRRMGMLFQFGALFTDMSVYDNIAFQMREHTDLPEA
jgi:phospholipid/cholesterol/gamma-HCH transport system ATP-binding protein